MFDFDSLSHAIGRQTVLCVGDLMLDEFVYGEVSRISPEAVDPVAIFEEDTPINLIAQVRPNVLVKGGDYTRAQVVGHEIVAANGGEIVLIDILEGFSTTSLVRRARESHP
jgi:bifunctional ADP-heptose synthase (sugar kinase/adenylyltransferase)